MKFNPSPSLLALSTTAIALPGIASADAPPVDSTLSYKISNYQEDDLSRSEVLFGDLERYDIDVHQFQLVAPVGRDFSLQINANYESMSGASPWFTTAGPDGKPIVALSGASRIEDSRSELSLGGSYYLENGSVSGNIGYSQEDDYRALYGGISGERHFNAEATTLGFGLSYSSDDIFPTDAEIFNRVVSEHKNSSSVFLSVSQIINQFSSFQSGFSLTQQSGFLSDPYKLRDVRPQDKTQLAWINSYRHFYGKADAALHINYRLYHDDFGISSHTLDAAWHQNIGQRYRLVPTLRYYSQSAADFFTNIDDFSKPLDEYQSSDYRLSAFGAISGSISLIADMDTWIGSITVERYIADDKYAAYQVSEPSAALISYNRVSLGIDYSF